MSLRKNNFVNNEVYHIYNRGVDKRVIFNNDDDHVRFIHDLYEFNNKNKALNLNNVFKYNKGTLEVGLPKIKRGKREVLVDILAYCLMDNHFHLMVRQKTDNGITEFMRKLGTGYTNYFNSKYKRNGALFQGKFKSILIKNDSHLMYLPIYIHLNPLDFKFPEWRNGAINEWKQAIDFLDHYRWSSFMDYVGKNNFPSLIYRDFLVSRVGDVLKQREEMVNWIRDFDNKRIDIFSEKSIFIV